MSSGTTARTSQNEERGKISLADGSPALSRVVVAFDKDLRSEQELGQATTGKDGAYLIWYDLGAAAGAEKGRVDVVVKVHDAKGSVLATSPVLFNAPQGSTRSASANFRTLLDCAAKSPSRRRPRHRWYDTGLTCNQNQGGHYVRHRGSLCCTAIC